MLRLGAVVLALMLAVPALAAPGDDAIATALAARRAGDFDKAQKILLAVVTDAPSNARALHELATLHAIHGELKRAADLYERALVADPSLTASRRALAEVLRAQGRCTAALPHFRKLEADGASRAIGLRGVAVCEEAAGNPEAALAALDALAREHPGDEFGRWAARQREVVKAAGKQGSISAEIAAKEGDAHFRRRRFDAAAAWYDHACRKGPTANRCYRHGIALLGARDFLGAVSALRGALRLDPGHMPSLSAWPTAVRMLRTEGAGGLDVGLVAPDREPAEKRAARALLDGDLLLARRTAEAGLKAGGGVVLRLQRAEALLRDGFTGAADKDYRAVLAKHPKHGVARQGRAVVYFRQRRFHAARRLAGLKAPPLPPVAASAEVRAAYGSPTRDL